MKEGFQKDWLKGLKVSGSTAKQVEKDGRKRTRHTPFERPMKETDVLDFTLRGGSVVLVAIDGQKHVVDLSAKDRKKLEADLADGGNEQDQ